MWGVPRPPSRTTAGLIIVLARQIDRPPQVPKPGLPHYQEFVLVKDVCVVVESPLGHAHRCRPSWRTWRKPARSVGAHVSVRESRADTIAQEVLPGSRRQPGRCGKTVPQRSWCSRSSGVSSPPQDHGDQRANAGGWKTALTYAKSLQVGPDSLSQETATLRVGPVCFRRGMRLGHVDLVH